ncbi:hypothetical protein GCM10028895_10330 [Pontibacter rugosus]
MKKFILCLLILFPLQGYSQNTVLLDQINGFKKIKFGMTFTQVKSNEFSELYGCPLVDNISKGYKRYFFITKDFIR